MSKRAPTRTRSSSSAFKKRVARSSVPTWSISIVGEMQDSVPLHVFGEAGVGLFAAPSALRKEIAAQHGLGVLGAIEDMRARYYVISGERKLKHPAVVVISDAARSVLSREEA